MTKHISRSASFLWITGMYIAALAAAVLAWRLLAGMHILLATFIADATATIVIWLFGVAVKNSSTYDPYWSVAPVVIAAFWALQGGAIGVADAMFMLVLLAWGVRLTANWARRWRGLGHQDWRYAMYRQKMPRLWFIVNLFGINMMPTVLVYLAMIPVFKGISSLTPANLGTAAGFILAAAAIGIEHTADRQMDAYKRRQGAKSPYIAEGLWLMCRHPNYLGEILFWWGLWVMQMSLAPAVWTIAGPCAVTLLFVFISIPMMEKHVVESRPEYGRIIADVPMLLPSPGKLAGLLIRSAGMDKRA